MMTKQEIFSTVVTHLRKQGKQSKRGLSCVYRGPEGTKCAIGCLIPDDDFKPEWEGFVVGSCSRAPANQEFQKYLVFKFGLNNLTFMMDLQRLHDKRSWVVKNGQYTTSWEKPFVQMANEHGLTIPEVQP